VGGAADDTTQEGRDDVWAVNQLDKHVVGGGVGGPIQQKCHLALAA